jgi:hypothetical protein
MEYLKELEKKETEKNKLKQLEQQKIGRKLRENFRVSITITI